MTIHTKHLPEGFRIEENELARRDEHYHLYKGDVLLASINRNSFPPWGIVRAYSAEPEFRSAVEAILVMFRAGMTADMAAWHLKCDLEMEQQHKAESDAAYAALFVGDERDVNR